MVELLTLEFEDIRSVAGSRYDASLCELVLLLFLIKLLSPKDLNELAALYGK